MTGRYDDIIDLPHHVSSDRTRMSRSERAAQFSPFAALVGYDTAIEETGRLTTDYIDLDVDGKAMLSRQIKILYEAIKEQPEVSITYYKPDERKAGGSYITVLDRVMKVDTMHQTLYLSNGLGLFFSQIYKIDCKLFKEEI